MLDVGDYYRDDLSRQTECRGKIREASNILKELVNEVLDMSKLESGEIYLEEKPFNIYQIINEVIDVVGEPSENIDRIKVYKNVIFWSFDLKNYSKSNWWIKTASTSITNKITIRTGNTIKKLIKKVNE